MPSTLSRAAAVAWGMYMGRVRYVLCTCYPGRQLVGLGSYRVRVILGDMRVMLLILGVGVRVRLP